MKLSAIFLLVCLLTQFNYAYGQKKNRIGIGLQCENLTSYTKEFTPGLTKTSRVTWNFGFSALYERVISKHSSFEAELKFRKALNDIYIPYAAGGNSTEYAHFLIVENFLSLPLIYKYNTNIVSLSLGPSFDFFLSWKDQRKYYYASLQDYKYFFDQKLSFGVLSGISKEIPLDKKIILEPAIYYNRILSFERSYYGGSLEIKYQL